jgi:hypothetical protein
MKISGLAAAAAILVTSLGLAAAADAQPPMQERTVVRTTTEARPMHDRTVVRTVVRGDDMDRHHGGDRRHYGWTRGHHNGWRNHHRMCRTVWRHHRRITTCRTW